MAKEVVRRLFPLGEKKELLTESPAVWVHNGLGDFEEFLESPNFLMSNNCTTPSLPEEARVVPFG